MHVAVFMAGPPWLLLMMMLDAMDAGAVSVVVPILLVRFESQYIESKLILSDVRNNSVAVAVVVFG